MSSALKKVIKIFSYKVKRVEYKKNIFFGCSSQFGTRILEKNNLGKQNYEKQIFKILNIENTKYEYYNLKICIL